MGEIAALPRRKQARCPICRKPSEARYRPFCSRHCADIDLGRWLGEGYRIPTDEKPEEPRESPSERDDESD
jgi:endogenous inhibitor of DNA gyrase (YacG/DUF329 family)